jgi:hypothetical protein
MITRSKIGLAITLLLPLTILIFGCTLDSSSDVFPSSSSEEQGSTELSKKDDPSTGLTAISGGDPSIRATEMTASTNWQTYRNEEFSFEIQYPKAYIIIEHNELSEALNPRPLTEVLFQDQNLTQGEILEPAQFSVRVFENQEHLSIKKWVKTHILISGEEEWEITKQGAGIQACNQFLMAPGCFVYFTKENYVYELTPFGPHSDEMLVSFKFTP